ncbi:MAG: hypothetical protein IRZ07_18275, partial [Microbispora sp.]|nr:hypothetical protein [Microbispora sp.]
PSPSPRATPSPSPSPKPTPTARRVYRSFREWLAAFDQAVREQERRGGIDRKLAREAHDAIRKTVRDMSRGRRVRMDKAVRRIRDLVFKLRDAHRSGKLADGPLTDFVNASGLSARRAGG